MTQKDLFDAGQRAKNQKTCTPYPVGSGPQDERCGTCANLCRFKQSKTWLKCGMMQHAWTGGTGTDIKARWTACRAWRPETGFPVWLAEPNITIDSREAALVAADWLEEHGDDARARTLRALAQTDYTFPMDEAQGSPDVPQGEVEIPSHPPSE